MSTIDLGDPLPDLSVNITDASGALANAGAVVLTITLPDGTTMLPAVANPSTGVYTASYTPAVRGRFTAAWVATGANASAFTTVYNVIDPASAVVGLTDAQSYLGVYTTSMQDEVRAVVEAATSVIEREYGRLWRRQTMVDTYDGGDDIITLRSIPVISITTVVESGVTLTGSDYLLNSTTGQLLRGGTTSPRLWLRGRQNIVVTSVVGMASIPEPVRQAVLLTARVLWTLRQGTQDSGPEDYAAPGDLIPRSARLMLDPYRAPGIA